MRDLLERLLLSALLCAGLWIAAEFWEARIRQDERELVEQEMELTWTKKLREVESAALAARSKQGETHALEVAAVYRNLDRARVGLQSRPRRTEQAITASGTCPAVPACTGDRLARDDAEFLTRYAAGVALVAAAEKEARAGYETCRAALRNATNGGSDGLHDRGPPD